MVTRRDYTAEAVEAAKSVLIELTHLLGEYRDNIVLIGGWVPELLIPQEPRPHVGSMDIDLALNHLKIREEGYKLIEELLTSRGYYQEKDAWDIYYCLLAYPGGIDALAEEFRPHLSHGLVQEGLTKIAKPFLLSKRWGQSSSPILKKRMIWKKWSESLVTPSSGAMPS